MKDNTRSRVIIIDDDVKSVDMLVGLIQKYCPIYDIVGLANNVEEGACEIVSKNPDLIFLDVEMPDGTGFDLLKMIKTRNFDVVFITAHNKYAIKAIKHSALDFLLKPFEISEFIEAIERIKSRTKENFVNYDVLLENVSTPKKLVIASSKGYEYIPVEDIVRLESDRSYAKIYLTSRRIILVSKCLNEYQNMLNSSLFFRVHNSHLINLNHVHMYVKSDGGYISMCDDSKIPVSRSKKELFINSMQQFIS